jgi:L-asparaginase II
MTPWTRPSPRSGEPVRPLFERVATVVRNGLPESWHFGAVAVVAPHPAGSPRLVARLGDPGMATYVRSAAKPFQALPLVLAGGVERFALAPADLALICASHGGTPEHTARAASLLARGGFTAADLLCGAHPPMDRESARRLESEGESPTPLHNNCSGKHAGMLLACRLLGFDPAGYVDPAHPLQQRILGLVARLSGLPAEEIGVGVDGCSAPAFHLPIEAAARSYAALAHPAGAGLDQDSEPGLAAALDRIVQSMGEAPEMVAGPGRFTTRLIRATGGRVVGKEGAEGFYAVAVRGPVALGIALKIADGGERCRDSVVLDVLLQLGSLSGAELSELAESRETPLYNHRGIRTGEIVPEVEMTETTEKPGAEGV